MKREPLSPNIIPNNLASRFLDFETKFKQNIQCVYSILQKENNIPSKRVIELAFIQNGNDYCTGCASADNIIRALKKLQELGIIACELKTGGYHWILIKD
ncbi:MAG: hypothetical protein GF308_11115 [Candidatus Heimdallarchaeota archaeon]|nr:hypothetical protein [Candidatus Heimdallarchaeota archaeon]